jgi:ABC-type multidrug transport system ATPase subunit|tara:strand:- start:499 stop:1158 length:660 start_codon:yes stop_codon:yes gene_type:complete
LNKNNIISINNLYKSFSGQNVLRDINFNIQSNEKLALIGSNGSGKTTLLKIISGILQPSSGTVFYDNINIHIPSSKKPSIGAAFNESMLDERMTVMENLQFYQSMISGDNDSTEISLLLKTFNIKNLNNVLIKNLSKGMKQRAVLIRALLNQENQSLLLLDEPSNNLDIDAKEILLKNVLQNTKKTIIAATHDIQNINRWATSVIELKNGRAILTNLKN